MSDEPAPAEALERERVPARRALFACAGLTLLSVVGALGIGALALRGDKSVERIHGADDLERRREVLRGFDALSDGGLRDPNERVRFLRTLVQLRLSASVNPGRRVHSRAMIRALLKEGYRLELVELVGDLNGPQGAAPTRYRYSEMGLSRPDRDGLCAVQHGFGPVPGGAVTRRVGSYVLTARARFRLWRGAELIGAWNETCPAIPIEVR